MCVNCESVCMHYFILILDKSRVHINIECCEQEQLFLQNKCAKMSKSNHINTFLYDKKKFNNICKIEVFENVLKHFSI